MECEASREGCFLSSVSDVNLPSTWDRKMKVTDFELCNFFLFITVPGFGSQGLGILMPGEGLVVNLLFLSSSAAQELRLEFTISRLLFILS